MKKRNIILLGSYGRGNAGDDIFLLSFIRLFHNDHIFCNVYDPSLLPKELRNKTSITFFATSILRDMGIKIRAFFSSEMIVYGGGNLWVDLYASRFMRASLWKMVFVNMIGKMTGKRVIYIGCGAGKLKGLSLFLAKLFIFLSDLVIFRDQKSYDLLHRKNSYMLPDPSIIYLSHAISNIEKKRVKNKRTRIGISVMYGIPYAHRSFENYKRQIAKFINEIDPYTHEIVFLPMMQENRPYDDIWASCEVAGLVKTDIPHTIYRYDSLDDLVKTISTLDMVISTRLHGCVIPILMGIPTIGISYRKKVSSFFHQQSLDTYVVELDQLSCLQKKYEDIIKQYDETKRFFENIGNDLLPRHQMFHNLIRYIS